MTPPTTGDTSNTPVTDFSALAWVHDELRRSLEVAHKSLRRFVREAEAVGVSDLDAVDPAVLRTARSQIHQGVGALELVGLPEAATLLRASEALVQRVVAKPQRLNAAVIEAVERASFGLLDYLSRLLAGKTVSPLSLFPQYRAVQEAAGAERVHPADLWSVDWQWRDLPSDPSAAPRPADVATRSALEGQLLTLMKTSDPARPAARMSDICAGLGRGAVQPQIATFWKLAAAVFEAQAQGLLGFDVFSKRVASRLLAQFRALEQPGSEVSERLAQDLLFFCAQSASPGDGRRAPRLAAVRLTYGLVHHVPADYRASALGRFDPAFIAQAKKRVVAAKEAWSAVAAGEMHRLAGLSEQFALVGESLKRLFPLGETFSGELQQAVAQTQAAEASPPAPLAMEVATSLLYMEAALEDADFDHPEQATRVQRLAERLAAVRQGRPPEALEGWMEELYRRVADRQTMGSVVQELRASLSEVEQSIDTFFRNPVDHAVLLPVPHQLASMRGVLSVLGMDHASAALLRMRDEVDGLIATEIEPQHVAQAGVFDRLAGNLGALGFLIDMLSVQPQMAKSLFGFDAATGVLSPVMGRAAPPAPATSAALPVEPRLIEQAQSLAFSSARQDVSVEALARDLELLTHDALAADQPALAATVRRAREAIDDAADAPALAAARGELSEALVDFVASSHEPVGLDAPLPPAEAHRDEDEPSAPLPPLDLAPVPVDPGLGDDAEMREVFLEEAREVLAEASSACTALDHAPDDLAQLTALRRAFHTLKGSARMLGLREFGEAAWVCEQVVNTHLAEQKPAGEALLDFTRWCLAELTGWVRAIDAGRADDLDSRGVAAAAARLAQGVAQPARRNEPQAVVEPAEAEPHVAPSAGDRAASEFDAFVFDFDLASLETPFDARDHAISTPVPLDLSIPALQEPFDGTAGSEFAAAAEPSSLPAPFDLPEIVAFPALPELPLPELPEPGSAPELLTLAVTPPERPAEPAPVPPVEPSAAEHLPHTLADGLRAPEAPPEPSLRLPEPPADPVELIALPEVQEIDISGLGLFDTAPSEPGAAPESMPGAEAAPEPAPASEETPDTAPDAAPAFDLALPAAPRMPEPADEQFRVVGPLRIGVPLYNIYLNEADELSRRLSEEVAEWATQVQRPIGELPIALAHSLAGSSATVGFADLSQLARALEHAQARSQAIGSGTDEEGRLFVDAADEIRRLLHQFAAGLLRQPSAALTARLADHERSAALRLEAATAAAETPAPTEHGVLLDNEASHDDPVTAAADVDAGADVETAVAAPAPAVRVEPPLAALPVLAAVPADPPPLLADTQFGLPGAGFGVADLKPFADLPADLPLLKLVVGHETLDDAESLDAVDAIDAELFPIFAEEAQELLPQLASRLRDWVRRPGDAALPSACMRTLHTLKGGARLAGAMRLGEMAHRLETGIEHLIASPPVEARDVETLQHHGDALTHTFEALCAGDRQAQSDAEQAFAEVTRPAPLPVASLPVQPSLPARPAQPAAASPARIETPASPPTAAAAPAQPAASRAPAPRPADASTGQTIDWSRFTNAANAAVTDAATVPARAPAPASAQSSVRVRAPVLDRLVNHAGEVSITRSRIETGVATIKGSLADLTENLDRLRAQLRDLEFHGEVQMSSRMEAAKAAAQSFDPLEFDRFTRFQELTRMMAESVNDVATVHRSVQRALEVTEDELVAQSRLTRELQDDLLRTRMVEFEGLSDRLYRVVRQAAKETGKSVRLDIVGGGVEVDRGVLDRMTGAFEHLLRNCVVHGIEAPERRSAAGKEPTGSVTVALSHEGNEVGVEFRDDGAGLDLPRIRAKAVALGLVDAASALTEAELANLIFLPGFTTVDGVTELAGRGVGMDVVRSEVIAMGGRIETGTTAGRGTSFKLVLPLTTAVTQVVMLRCGDTDVAVPSTLIESIHRATPAQVEAAHASGTFVLDAGSATAASGAVPTRPLPFFWLGALLQTSAGPGASESRTRMVVVVRSAQQRIALHVDEVLGNREVVVKNLGPQLSRLPGLTGVTLLASGEVALIYNPVALATLYGTAAQTATQGALRAASGHPQDTAPEAGPATQAPLVLVVDDSLTVRRVTQRLLTREGYRVVLAKDGLDALERLAEAVPAMVLSDIEMPRMDGFDLVRNMRADARLRELPVIMITSRIAQKHREHAAQLGVDHYLGKPYSEDELLALVARYTAHGAVA